MLGRPRKYNTPEELREARRQQDRVNYAKRMGSHENVGRPRKYATPEERREAKRASDRRRYAARREGLGGNKAAENYLIYQAFKEQGCTYCPEKNPVCIDAHHVDPQTKRWYPSMVAKEGSPEQLRDELALCIPVCANCHRKLHAGLLP